MDNQGGSRLEGQKRLKGRGIINSKPNVHVRGGQRRVVAAAAPRSPWGCGLGSQLEILKIVRAGKW